jgi:uncharacterized membrane protein YbhN (UPF0104 family)
MVETADRTSRPRWKRLGLAAIKLAVAALVLWFVGRHVAGTWMALGRHGKPLAIEPAWLVLAGGLYLAGLTFSGVFFHQVMRASPSPVRRYAAIRAYLVSHLAKYVPGKAMVVVVRAGMVVPYGAKGVTAAVATFYETLAMMAAGGLIAAIGFGTTSAESDTLITFDSPPGWDAAGKFLSQIPLFGLCAALGLAMGLAFLVVVTPPVFGRLTRLVTTPFGGAEAETSPRFSGRLLAWGLFWSTCCWVLLGLSQLAVVRAVSPLGPADAARLAPLAIGGVAIATVAGFVVAVLPGGLGVREGVLMAALGPVVGDGVAVASAILLRLVWIAAELAAGGVLVMIRPRPIREPIPGTSAELQAPAAAPAEMGRG